MSTTSDALQSDGTPVYCWVAAIEGYSYLLTDHVDTAAVLTAWAASEWTQCLGGLKVRGTFSQRFRPWQTDLDIQTILLAVKPDEDDTFGKAVFAAKGSYNSRLTETFQPADDGSGTINVKSTAGADNQGEVHIGGVKHSYSSKTATTFTVGVAGANVQSPFSAHGGNRYSPPAVNPANVNADVAVVPGVSSQATKWSGRKVALYIHRIVDGVLDELDEAHLEFAGCIRDFWDTEEGDTVLELQDLRAKIRDATVLEDQWIGYVKPGIRLLTGTRLRLREMTNAGEVESGELTVVASGASGADELNAGVYAIDEFLSALNAWAADDGTIEGKWEFAVKTVADIGKRTIIAALFASGDPRRIQLRTTSLNLLEMLGCPNLGGVGGSAASGYGGGASVAGGAFTYNDGTTDWWIVAGHGEDNGLYPAITSALPPFRIKFLQNRTFGTLSAVNVELEASEGTFFNQREFLPPALRPFSGSTGSWGIFQVGNGVYLGRLDDADHISGLSQGIATLKYVDDPTDSLNDGVTYDDEEEKLAVRQVLLLEGSFTDIMTKLVASIPGGASGVNHADYDVLPWGAGIPWSLLGDNWLDSCAALEEALNSKSITTLLTEPTRLLDILIPELCLRFAWIGWKDGGYQVRTLPTPNATTPDHVFDETNKAVSADTLSPDRSITQVTTEFLRNVVKLDYARNAAGKYRRHLTIKDQTSITENGGPRAWTIQAVNSFGQEAGAAASIEELVASVVARVFPRFAKPLWTVRRSISPELFHAVPGDTGRFSDDFARDPTSGARGVTNRAAVVLQVMYDRGNHGGKMAGEVELLLSGEDRHYPMSPAAEIDATYSGTLDGLTFTNGYAAAGPAIKLKDHAYSRASDAKDITRFTVGDLLRIHRLETSDAWSRTIAAKDEADGYITLSATFSSPAFTAGATERYRVQPREFSACTAAQKLFAFQADDDDGFIEDLADPNTYGEQQWEAFGSPTLADLPILPTDAECWGDGMPFHPGLLHDISLFNNNLPSYRTAPNSPLQLSSPYVSNAVVYQPVLIAPWFLGPPGSGGLVRKLKLAPFIKTTNADNTCTVRVTSSAQQPRCDAANGVVVFPGGSQSVEFTTTATSYAEATEQSLLPVRASGVGMLTWITVEMKASNAARLSGTYGLSRCYLGPLEVA